MPDSSEFDSLNLLLDVELTEVNFVQNYLILKFDDFNLQIYIKSKIIVNQKTYKYTSMHFCFYLISCINKFVKKINFIENDSITLLFSNGVSLDISLKPKDYICPEAIYFINNPMKLWFVL